MKKLIKILLLTLLSLNIIVSGIIISTERVATSPVPRATARIYMEPQNATANVGGSYTISVKIADVTNLYGFTIQMRWGTAVLKYVSHTVTIPVETYPGGVLHSNVFQIEDKVDETASIPGAANGTTYSIKYLSLPPAPSFNGTGTVFNMTFQVLRDGECDIFFTSTLMSTPAPAQPIPHTVENAFFYRPGSGKVPVADFTFSPDPAVANKATQFDASASYDQDPGGDIARYIWNFGDGTIENTTSPTRTHTFTSLPDEGYYLVELTVLDDQGGGSQSKPKYRRVGVVSPRPVAIFTVWPEDQIAVVNKNVRFNASESYDPDPGGSITTYRWVFGDGNETATVNPTITHKYAQVGIYIVNLTVRDDSDGLWSASAAREVIEVVERRDIGVVSVTAAPSEVKQGEQVAINVTIANRGQADENFDLVAYYNTTATDWIEIDRQSISGSAKQFEPLWELTHHQSVNSTVDRILKTWVVGGAPDNTETTVKVSNHTGFWTINPGRLNDAANSSGLIAGTPLSTGGWIFGSGSQPYEPLTLNGEFSPGNWSLSVRLRSTEANVNATIWVRVIKSDNPNPHAGEARITVVKNWTSLFPETELPTSAQTLTGNISIASTTLTDEYLYCEFQIEVTENLAGNTTEVVFQTGGPFGNQKPQIKAATFSARNEYTLNWDTEFASPGNHVVLVNASGVPHETSPGDNVAYSNSILVEPRPTGIPLLDVTVDVGSMHFQGEISDFYILVSSSGKRVNATIIASIIFNGDTSEISPTEIKPVTTGVYLISYQIPIDASPGTYVLVADAERHIPEANVTQQGTSLKGFLVSSTFAGWDAMFTDWDTTFADWDAMLIAIEGDTATILTGLGEIQANLTAINATLSGIIADSNGEILAEIDTALGTLVARLDNVNATVTSIDGNTLTLNSTLGEAQASLGVVQSTLTIGLAAASTLSAIATVVAILILLRIRKIRK